MTLAYGPKARPAIVVHGLDQAVAALEAAAASGTAVAILSAPGAAAAGGAGWWRALAERAGEAVPTADALFVLDCADEAGRALEAIRAGVPAIAIELGGETRARLAAIAERAGCLVVAARDGRVLDLATVSDPRGACAAWLADGNIGGPPDVANPGRVG